MDKKILGITSAFLMFATSSAIVACSDDDEKDPLYENGKVNNDVQDQDFVSVSEENSCLKYEIVSDNEVKVVGIKDVALSTTTSIVIPNEVLINNKAYAVTAIADNAFTQNHNIEKVVISKSVKSIGNKAFYRCLYLRTAAIPNSTTIVGDSAFYYCSNLEVQKPVDLKGGDGAFSYCKNVYTGKAGDYTYIDLGLSVKWASYNIGQNDDNYGDLFAWGETETANSSLYKWYNSDNTIAKYCTNETLGTVDNIKTLTADDDAATVNWGKSWRMPTIEEYKELLEGCDVVYTENYTKFVSKKNGNYVYFPNSKMESLSNSASYGNLPLITESYYGECWSSSLDESSPKDAYLIHFQKEDSQFPNSGNSIKSMQRTSGKTVRAVLVD